MNRWEMARQERRVAEISRELGRLLRFQTEFLSKGSSSVQEHREYTASFKRIRELFAELKKLRIAA